MTTWEKARPRDRWDVGKVYVASSWRNPLQQFVVAMLQGAKIDVYDFKHPTEGNDGFHWSDVMPSYERGKNTPVSAAEYLHALNSERAQEGFALDYEAMEECRTCIMVLPCGKSAHLELGWFEGHNSPQFIAKNTAILLPPGEFVEAELMYRMAQMITDSPLDLLDWLGVKD